jgi:hypothetical protein
MQMTIEVMKQAVDALESVAEGAENPMETRAAITALRQAISQPDCTNCYAFHANFGECDYEKAYPCINGNKFDPMPKVLLYMVTPQA